ncbi:TetR/AcrR family transcriptional regulator [Streptomyces phaeochromogenes]|uniref:TetR/AcrR family transcriptional regulator n=1 Tax=Streptomyces phaeochromogenes TaxID=1923 RepID=UPI0034018ECF
MTAAPEQPAWRRRAVERSTRAAKLRAEERVQRFLDSAYELIAEKGTTDFTVQEVVNRSKQSLRSFYQYFDGKHELLLALFEDTLAKSADEIREAAASKSDPLRALRLAVEMLHERARPGPDVPRPLFGGFALQLLVKHPSQVAAAHRPLLMVFAELIERAADAGVIAAGRPRRQAALVLQTVMFAAQAHGSAADGHAEPVTSEEVWRFCLGGISGSPPTAGRPATA